MSLSPDNAVIRALAELDPVDGKWEKRVPNSKEERSCDELGLPGKGQGSHSAVMDHSSLGSHTQKQDHPRGAKNGTPSHGWQTRPNGSEDAFQPSGWLRCHNDRGFQGIGEQLPLLHQA